MEALVIQHQDDAPAGLVLDALRAAGVRWQTVHLDRGDRLPDPRGVRLAIPLGSDAAADDDEGPEWIGREQTWLADADRAGTTILGVCFGAQALAAALGGGVARASIPERGWIEVDSREPDLVAAGPWLAWHDDVISLPAGAELVAENASGPQAFRIGRHLGVQFHPEVTPEIVDAWVRGSRDGELPDVAALAPGAEPYRHAAANAARLFSAVVRAARVR